MTVRKRSVYYNKIVKPKAKGIGDYDNVLFTSMALCISPCYSSILFAVKEKK